MYCAFEKSKRDRVMRTERLAMSKISKSKPQKIPQVVSRFTQRLCICESDDRLAIVRIMCIYLNLPQFLLCNMIS